MILARSRRVLDGKVGFTFAWMGKVRDSSLALRALNSMVDSLNVVLSFSQVSVSHPYKNQIFTRYHVLKYSHIITVITLRKNLSKIVLMSEFFLFIDANDDEKANQNLTSDEINGVLKKVC